MNEHRRIKTYIYYDIFDCKITEHMPFFIVYIAALKSLVPKRINLYYKS